MTPTKKIAINTLASYFRTIIAILLVLFSSRWVLNSLGASDYGIFSLVGSLLVFITFFNNVLATADARFFAIELGSNENNLKNVFKSSVIIHLIIPVVLILIGGIIGSFAIRYWLSIPELRIDASITIFYFSLVAVFFNMFSVPYKALFIASQNIVSSTILELMQTILFFVSAYVLRFLYGDLLISYSLLYCFSQVIICMAFIMYAKKKFPLYINWKKGVADKSMMKSILKFSFWSALGDLGHLIRTQGIVIVVNLLYSTEGNAALGVANQVSAQASNLSNALMRSVSPEIYTRVGKGDLDSGVKLVELVNKIAVLLMFVLGVPLILNMDEILKLWLINVPPHTAELCICFIIMFIIERYTMGHYIVLSAMNKIAKMQIGVFVSYLLSVILPFLGLCSVFGISGVGISCIISMIVGRVYIAYCYNLYLKINVRDLLLRFITISILVLALVIVVYKIIPYQATGWIQVCLSCAIIDTILSILYIVSIFTKEEIGSLKSLI